MGVDWVEIAEDFVDSAMEFIDSDEEVVRFFEDMRFDLDKLCEKKRKELRMARFQGELVSFLKDYCGQAPGRCCVTEHNYNVMARTILQYVDKYRDDAEAMEIQLELEAMVEAEAPEWDKDIG